MAAIATGCKDSPLRREQTLDIGTDTITLPASTDIHDIRVASAEGRDFEPASSTARAGDVIRFTARDARTHVVHFTALPGQARQLFESKTQLRSPPLLVNGASWIVSLDNAPAGTYQFRCDTHGYGGQLVVK